MNRLQTHIQIEGLAGGNRDDALSPLLGQRHGESVFTHLARLADDVAGGQDKGTVQSGSHPAMLPAEQAKKAGQ